MKARHLLAAVLLLGLDSQPIFAGEPENLKEQFKQAYLDYKTAVGTKDNYKILKSAEVAFESGEKVYTSQSGTLAALSLNYSNALFSAREYEGALDHLKTTEKLYKKVYGKDSIELTDVYMTRGQAYIRLHNYKGARSSFNKSVKPFEKLQDADSRLIKASLQLEIGNAFLNTIEANFSGKYLADAVNTYSEILGSDHQQTAVARFWRGKYYLAAGKNNLAARELESVVITLDSKTPNQKTALMARAYLVNIYEQDGKSQQATRHCKAIGLATPAKKTQDKQPLFTKEPEYPRSLLKKGQEGYAIVNLTIDSDGFVRNPKITSLKGGQAFGKAALVAVGDFRYAPAYVDGKAIEQQNVSYKFNFTLAN